MKTAFIIAEYNPFHNGHRYHAQKTREESGAEAVVAVMSGDFVQRGDIAVADRFLRAETAVRGGVDLVVELPVKYTVSNAVHFARGAVDTIHAFGLDGVISFGASASMEALAGLGELINDKALREKTETLSRTAGKTYPAAMDAVLKQSGCAHEAALLTDPNNVLALEYLKRMRRYASLSPMTVNRPPERGHHSEANESGFAGASYIRALLENGGPACVSEKQEALGRLLPETTIELLAKAAERNHFPVDRTKYEVAVYSRLLTLSAEDFLALDNVTQGLENRILPAIRDNSGVMDAVTQIKSKRQTMARLRQIFVAAALGVTKEDVLSAPSYLRVLAFNGTGRRLLGELRECAALPLVTNLSDAVRDPVCSRDAALEYAAGKLFDLCLPQPRGGNRPFLDHPVMVD